jgi:hypothetical protein
MPADALDPSAAPEPVAELPTERQRATRAVLLGATLGALLAWLGRRRGARYSR